MPSIELIKQDWEKDSALKEKCIKESRDYILNDQSNRALDYIPHLIPEYVINRLRYVFSILIENETKHLAEDDTNTLLQQLRQVSLFVRSEEEKQQNSQNKNEMLRHLHEVFLNLIPEEGDRKGEKIYADPKKMMTLLFKIIAAIGCRELFDERGELKSAWIDSFHWHDLKDKINSLDLMCAYVGSVLQQIHADKKANDIFLKHQDSYMYWTPMVNQNYRSWTKQMMDQFNIKYVDRSNSLMQDIMSFPKKHPEVTALMVAGVGFGAVGIAATLFGIFVKKQFQSDTPNDFTRQFKM